MKFYKDLKMGQICEQTEPVTYNYSELCTYQSVADLQDVASPTCHLVKYKRVDVLL